MSVFRDLINSSFVDEGQGETLFIARLGWFRGRRVYTITSEDDVEALRKYLRIHYWVFFCVAIPIIVVALMPQVDPGSVLRWGLWLLACGTLGWAYSWAFQFLVMRQVLRKYEYREKTPGFRENRERIARTTSWTTYRFSIAVWVSGAALAIILLLLGETTTGWVALIVFGIFGFSTILQMRLKQRLSRDSSDT